MSAPTPPITPRTTDAIRLLSASARDDALATDVLDVLVVGAGQAGLAVGYHLRSTGLRFQLLDRHTRVGDSWRQRYDSLVLFTPRRYSALPGLILSGDPEGLVARSTRALRVSGSSFIGRRLRAADPFPAQDRDGRALVEAGVRLVPRLVEARGGTARFADGARKGPDL